MIRGTVVKEAQGKTIRRIIDRKDLRHRLPVLVTHGLFSRGSNGHEYCQQIHNGWMVGERQYEEQAMRGDRISFLALLAA